MLDLGGTSYALFAAVWGLMCLLSGAVVTDTMLRHLPSAPTIDAEQTGDTAVAEV